MLHKLRLSSLLFLSFFLFLSCQSVKQPASVPEPINYSDEDIVQNEIERINSFLEKEPLRALWRASLLGRQEVIDLCFSKVEELFLSAYEEKNYLDARKYYKSLKTVRPLWKSERYLTSSWKNLSMQKFQA